MRTTTIVVLVLATAALGQRPPGLPPPLEIFDVMHLGHEAVHKELGLDEASAAKATALSRGATWAAKLSRGELKAHEVVKQIEMELGFLSAAQRKRLREVTIGQLERNSFGSGLRILARGLEADLKLSRTQLTKIERPGAVFVDALTPEQRKIFETLKGKPFAGAVTPGAAVPHPPILQLFRYTYITSELKPDEEQKAKWAALARRWDVRALPRMSASPDQVKEAKELAAVIDKEARAVLTKEQAKRLAQIEFSLRHRIARGQDLFFIPEVVAVLKLSADQVRKVKGIIAERRKGIAKLFRTDVPASAVLASLSKYDDETKQLLLVALDERQREALNDLQGDPLPHRPALSHHLPREATRQGPPPRRILLDVMVLVGTPALHKELGLEPDEAKLLTAIAERAARERPASLLAMEQRAIDGEKELAAVLTPAQLNRLRELAFQHFVGTTGNLARFAEVREGLGLSAEQLKKLGPGKALEDVLTDAQKARWKEMLGKPAGFRLAVTAGKYVAPLPLGLRLLTTPAVAEEMKLSRDQKEKIASVAKVVQTAATLNPDRLGVLGLNAEYAATDVLDDAQKKRLAQLKLQCSKADKLYHFLLHPHVQKVLKLPASQRSRMSFIELEQQMLERALSDHLGGPGYEETREKIKATLSAASAQRMEALLDADQKKIIAEQLGPPFKGTLPRWDR